MRRQDEIKSLLDQLSLPCEIDNKGRHLKVSAFYRGQRKAFFASRTPSDERTSKNFKADIVRWMRAIDNKLVDNIASKQ